MPTYHCVICSREMTWRGPRPALYPFCSSRCRWVDLGLWLREAYVIDREAQPEDCGLDRHPQQNSGNEPHD